jgi:hypothetical protein
LCVAAGLGVMRLEFIHDHAEKKACSAPDEQQLIMMAENVSSILSCSDQMKCIVDDVLDLYVAFARLKARFSYRVLRLSSASLPLSLFS